MQALDFVNDMLMRNALSVKPNKALALGQILVARDLKLVGSVGCFLMGGGCVGEPPRFTPNLLKRVKLTLLIKAIFPPISAPQSR